MRSKNTKLTTLIYLPYECAAIEEYLNKMAEKGWILVSINSLFFKFKKTNQKNIKYSVDILDKVSIFDTNDTEVALEYREYCMAAGWTYICQTGKIQIFYSIEAEKIIPIHTDEGEKFKSVFKGSLYNLINQFFITLILIFNIYTQLFYGNTDFLLSSNFMLWSIVLMFSLIFVNIIESISFFLWVIKAKCKIKENKFMPYNSYKQLIRKNIFKSAYILAVILIFIRFSFFDNSSNKQFSVFLLLMIVLTILVMICVQRFINKKRHSKITNIIITIFSSLGLGFLMIIIAVVMVMGAHFQESEIQKEKSNLTLIDFGYNENNVVSLDIDFNKSILAQRTDYFCDNKDITLSYKILQSQYPWVIEFHKNILLSRLNNINIDLNEKSTNLPNNIKVYSYRNKKSFLLVSEDKVVTITNDFSDISDDEFLDMVYKKLL